MGEIYSKIRWLPFIFDTNHLQPVRNVEFFSKNCKSPYFLLKLAWVWSKITNKINLAKKKLFSESPQPRSRKSSFLDESHTPKQLRVLHNDVMRNISASVSIFQQVLKSRLYKTYPLKM